MPLDANSRFIAGVCSAAVILLATWFHGNGKNLDRALSHCEASGVQAQQPRDCIPCERDEGSHADAERLIACADGSLQGVRCRGVPPVS